jgi:hypothetical protein
MNHVLRIASLGVALLSGCGKAESDEDPIDVSGGTGAGGGAGGSTGGAGGSTGGAGGSTGGAGGSTGGAGGSTGGASSDASAGSGGSAGASDAGTPCPQAPPGPDAACGNIAVVLVETAPCVYAIDAPPGKTLDPNATNVALAPGSGAYQLLGNVCTEADCATHTNGWYFDHNAAPTQIVLCPDACALVDPNGAVHGLLGCGTITAAPN